MSQKELFEMVLKSNCERYTSLMFNLYEDEKYFTFEAVFDDEEMVIGRENPAVICEAGENYELALRQIQTVIKEFYRRHKESLSNLKEISYGFVDGDLYYIIKRKKKKTAKKDMEKFTAESFRDFDIVKLDAWISVYVKEEDREKYNLPLFPPSHPSEKMLEYYRNILADHFDYEAYYRNV